MPNIILCFTCHQLFINYDNYLIKALIQSLEIVRTAQLNICHCPLLPTVTYLLHVIATHLYSLVTITMFYIFSKSKVGQFSWPPIYRIISVSASKWIFVH